MGVLPDIARGFERLYGSFWEQPHVPATTLELCRLRLAQIHRCQRSRVLREVQLPQQQIEQLPNWPVSELFSPGERAALEFAEMYAMDTGAITDEQVAEVKRFHGDAGLVTLIEALGVFDGRIRLGLLWQLPPETEPGAGD